MPKKYKKGLFVFHRDLRIVDNTGLVQACIDCEKVYTCFIFTPEQVGAQNKYRSLPAIRFMLESLTELSAEIRKRGGELHVVFGDPTDRCRELIQTLDISAVYINRDYSPYAVERDQKLALLCDSRQVDFHDFADTYLFEPGTVKTSTGKYYQKYTPFYDTVVSLKVPKPYPAYTPHTKTFRAFSGVIPHETTLKAMFDKLVGHEKVESRAVHGGRHFALERLRKSVREQTKYDDRRDFFEHETTRLSAYLKFGCISVREAYHEWLSAFGRHSGLIRELIWREYYAHILYGFPHVLGGVVYRNIRWRTSARDFERWKQGQTGFPLVDACMRQLNATGYMHNRGRMVVAHFLVKTLLIHWKRGEEYFAQRLVDYDPASNNGNWQRISGTGIDRAPYFRDMNPWIQSAKYDPDAKFIRHWVPELADVPPVEIHKWEVYAYDSAHRKTRYPKPMVSYREQKEKMLEMYRRASFHSD
jgi:deoxyribodipyrimidine photo-lyase